MLLEILRCDEANGWQAEDGTMRECAAASEIDAFIERIVPEVWINSEHIDFATVMDRSTRATFRRNNFIIGDLMESKSVRENWIYLRKNFIEVEDAQLQLGFPDREDIFYDVEKADQNRALSTDKNLVMKTRIGFGFVGMLHRRQNYSLMGILGDVGGVFELLCSMVGVFLIPISRHSFMLHVLKKTYNVEQYVESEESE